MLPVCSATQCCSSHSQGRKTPYLLMSSLRFSEKEMAFLILGEPLGFAMQDRYQVIVMDADGSRSKGIARSLRKLGVKRPYLVQGGFQSWVKQGIQVKELKPETVLTILNEGFAAASYALLEWEKTLQFVAIIGISQTWSPGIFMGSRKTGKQPHWFTYITFILRCSKPGSASCCKA
eukprot:XP_024447533.1 uncharacterized protein LOC112325343 isoform X9 [Populus trichocarpa]